MSYSRNLVSKSELSSTLQDKAREFDRASGEPALLVLGFKPSARITESSGPANTLQITGARVALDAARRLKLRLSYERIASSQSEPPVRLTCEPTTCSISLAIFCCPA